MEMEPVLGWRNGGFATTSPRGQETAAQYLNESCEEYKALSDDLHGPGWLYTT
jgi:hypothetical protein